MGAKRDNFFNAEILRIALKSKKITQKELAEKIGVNSQSTIANYLSGRTIPSLRTAQKIADVLGLSVRDFLSEDTLNSIRPRIVKTTDGEEAFLYENGRIYAEYKFAAREIRSFLTKAIRQNTLLDENSKTIVFGLLVKTEMLWSDTVEKLFEMPTAPQNKKPGEQ